MSCWKVGNGVVDCEIFVALSLFVDFFSVRVVSFLSGGDWQDWRQQWKTTENFISVLVIAFNLGSLRSWGLFYYFNNSRFLTIILI